MRVLTWFARVVVAVVFLVNMQCAVSFIVDPSPYMAGFELSGAAGRVAVRGLGIAFLMWNATYPLVVVSPVRQRVLFGVVIVQQLIGFVGEIWLATTIGTGHAVLQASIGRFALFDGAGLLLMLIAFLLTAHAGGSAPE